MTLVTIINQTQLQVIRPGEEGCWAVVITALLCCRQFCTKRRSGHGFVEDAENCAVAPSLSCRCLRVL